MAEKKLQLNESQQAEGKPQAESKQQAEGKLQIEDDLQMNDNPQVEEILRIAGVIKESVVDGPGMRYVVFVQGCPHRCEGCHNPQTHDFEGGELISISQIADDLDKDPLLAGVTFSGGEPMAQASALSALADEVKKRNLDLMIYSGYTFERLQEMAKTDEGIKHLLCTADKLVDGPFVLAERNLELQFRGSSNQRYIDLPKTLEAGHIVPVKTEWDIEIKY